ncbi:preprotein translocase subunit SecA [candidate division WWE3 bacterium CG08_land_8_20_14_0_20_40_13]|uniref:Protein translocase subunit SecA n=1 Tax=candidate division WWE3 bacterium CG08_land_8_20_14_0_20_40_13 TaxID=1975084 RepID=A0A2H0XEM2_UNCKA|nr:MAG: preprotein translocase subunit SecA [candidate division WWE3 bacterium CG08_land_8_20_14_0_20_40_13]
MNKLFSFLDLNKRKIDKLKPLVLEINKNWEQVANWDDKDFPVQTEKFKEDLKNIPEIEKKEEYLNSILPLAFAMVKEATKRVQKIELHDEQLIAGIVLTRNAIAEQKTGEGKTNTAVLPLYLNSLTEFGCHLVTPNDYLSRHGAGWMGPIYHFLCVSVSVIIHEESYLFDPTFNNEKFLDKYAKHLKLIQRKEAYACNITYGTNNEFGFDYLRDNMAQSLSEIVQTNPLGNEGSHNFAVVDEVDSLLVDEARTPLIISAPAEDLASRYKDFSAIAGKLVDKTDYEIDEKFKTAALTDLGIRKVEKILGVENLYEKDFESIHLIENAVRAKNLYLRDRDYVVKEGEIVIVDEFTGRLMPGRRWSEGLHQAIEAKEGVQIQKESRTLATISFQNYFRMYRKLAGMTGTAETEAEEFFKIYNLDVFVIPTNLPVTRKDLPDLVYKTKTGKYQAVLNEIETAHNKGQPILVGSASIENNELLSKLLTRKGIKHEILNAKQHEREAMIISQAGRRGAVTLATNMAGRGVDIKLGGDPTTPNEKNEAIKLGGLYVMGTERHEARRIDNQLRGRSGRQGEPGTSRFFVSLQDELMRIFGGAQIEGLMNRFGMDENTPLESGIVSKAIENAQKKVEGFNFDARKRVVEYDDVMNVHRRSIYGIRRSVLNLDLNIRSDSKVKDGNEDRSLKVEKENPLSTFKHLNPSSNFHHLPYDFKEWYIGRISPYFDKFSSIWDKYYKRFGPMWLEIVKQETLRVIDYLWMEHLDTMDDLREGIGLRGYAQIDPIIAYKKEGKKAFEKLMMNIWATLGNRFSKINIEAENPQSPQQSQDPQNLVYKHNSPELGVTDEAREIAQAQSKKPKDDSGNKIGRNDLCPCGSGKKYKRCHGK